MGAWGTSALVLPKYPAQRGFILAAQNQSVAVKGLATADRSEQ